MRIYGQQAIATLPVLRITRLPLRATSTAGERVPTMPGIWQDHHSRGACAGLVSDQAPQEDGESEAVVIVEGVDHACIQ